MGRTPLLLLLVWLALPLAVLSIYAFSTFRQATMAGETEALMRQAGQLAAQASEMAAKGTQRLEDSGIWGSLLSNGMLVRLVDASGNVRIDLASDVRLAKAREPHFQWLSQPAVVEAQPDRLYVMAPVFTDGLQSGIVELGRNTERLVLLRRRYALGLFALSFLSLIITGFVAAVYSRMRRDYSLERQRHYWADLFHELRTPLTVIESYAGMMKRWAGSDPKVREEAIEVIVSEASRLRRLAARLLTDAEGDERGMPLQLTPFDLAAQLRDVAQRLGASFGRDIRVGGKDKELKILGDPEQLQQIWVILLDNALKYSSKPIEIEIAAVSKDVTVTVRDRGIGIPYQELPQLFDRHYRGIGVRRRRAGAGLGLAIAGGIVRRHSGSIRIDSEPGAGTAVTVTLPIL